MALGCEFGQTRERRVSECEWALFALMLISCWTAAADISFGRPSALSDPFHFVPGQISACSLWPYPQNNMSCVCKVHVGGWICMCVFFLNRYLPREVFLLETPCCS